MNNKREFRKLTTRRDFVKKNTLGGFIYAFGIPFLTPNLSQQSFGNSKWVGNPSSYEEIDWTEIRKQFLLASNKHYFNTASLGMSPKTVVDRVCDVLRDLEVKGADGHRLSSATNEKLGKFLNVDSEEVAITRNATESMNIIARSLPLKAGDEVLLTKHEHIGGAAPWLALQKDIGVVVKLVDLDLNGEKNLQLIKESITDRTKVISISHITCTTGMTLPVKDIVALCKEKGIYSCIDGAQAIGMIPIDLKDINPDFYACSGHKWLFGPKGTGVLFINKSVIEKCTPTFVGANSDQKFNLNTLTLEYRNTAQREEYGSRNVPLTLGLGTAIDFVSSIGIDNIVRRGRELVDYFYKGISQLSNIEILTPVSPEYSASIVTIRIKGKDNFKVTERLFDKGKIDNGNYIRVRGIYENEINGIRISFAIFNSMKEIDYLLDNLNEIISG